MAETEIRNAAMPAFFCFIGRTMVLGQCEQQSFNFLLSRERGYRHGQSRQDAGGTNGEGEAGRDAGGTNGLFSRQVEAFP